MAHFAKIDENTNEVLTVLKVNDSDVLNENGVETESVGQQYLEQNNNWPVHLWIQTSYNTRNGKYLDENGELSSDQSRVFRGNYATVGSIWDAQNQLFWPPKPFPSWVKNSSEVDWQSPIGAQPSLTEEQVNQNLSGTNLWGYIWNEDNQSWDLFDNLNP